jgi:nucleotide-binding universal stress UspA family protein
MNDRRILVATDFSTRSDRAIRRGTLLAKETGARLHLVHVVDDDQPSRIVEAERTAADSLLNDLVQAIRTADGLDCDALIVEGDPFEGIARAAKDMASDLVVIGPHRRQVLRDMFLGTTAERTIRFSSQPIIMANGVPAGPYRHILVAVDFSECSGDALRAVRHLGIDTGAAVSVVHVFDPIAAGIRTGAASADSLKDYLAEEAERASRELSSFLADAKCEFAGRFVKQAQSSTANTICKAAQEASADLLVVGTHGRTGLGQILLGSVAQDVLRTATIDVLAVPPE